MEFLIPFLIPPAAFAALVAALYYFYPSPLIHGWNKFGGYLVAGLRRKYITVNNITYCYYERESVISPNTKNEHTDENGCPKTFLFLHGYTGNKVQWLGMVRYLPKEWRLIVVDLPGHGESSFHLSEKLKYDSFGFAEKIHEFTTALDLHNMTLVGCSLGALITATYASRYPQHLKSIILMCPPGAHKFPQGIKTEFLTSLEKGHNMVMPKNAQEFQGMLDLVLYDSSKFTFPLRLRQALVDMQTPNYPNFAKIQQDLLDLDNHETAESVKHIIEKISVPILMMWGDNDRVFHPSGAEILGGLVEPSQVSVVIVDQCGHAMTLDRPRKCAQLAQEFITQRVTQ